MSDATFQVTPIGAIDSDGRELCIRVLPEFAPGLRGLDECTHAIIVYWCHLARRPTGESLVVESPYASGPSALGTFATRSPERPNPIAMTCVRIARVDARAGELRTPWIDAAKGSPVLDIKPYVAALDRVRAPLPPAWCAHWPEWVEDAAKFDWMSELTADARARG